MENLGGGLVIKSCPTLATLWTVACQAPLSMKFSSQNMEWVAISFSRGSSWPRDQTHIFSISCIGRQVLYHSVTMEASLWTHIKALKVVFGQLENSWLFFLWLFPLPQVFLMEGNKIRELRAYAHYKKVFPDGIIITFRFLLTKQ